MHIDDDIRAAMLAWRRDFHAHPETAYEERRTASVIAEALRGMGFEPECGLAGTGLVASLTTAEGPAIGLRADMDALPVPEATGLPYASVNEGRMHACGHDGHMAMLLGAAMALSRRQDFKGTVRFIFQPAEENEVGGRRMVEEGFFERFPCDAVYGMHNWPGLPAGRFAVNPGPMMASMDVFDIRIAGRGCHAAMPERGADPFVPAAQLALGLLSLPSRRVSPLDPAVVSVTQMHGGDTWNVIPDEVLLRGCVRTFSGEVQDELEASIRCMAEGTAAAHGARASVNYERRYLPVINSVSEAALAARAALATPGAAGVETAMRPSMASEDFAYFLRERPGALVWLGGDDAAHEHPLHSPHYDFNDALLDIGCAFWLTLAGMALPMEKGRAGCN
jgi:hippurate hydrolase